MKKPNEFAAVVITTSSDDDWFAGLTGCELFALLEFSVFNGQKKLFAARPVDLPPAFAKHHGRSIRPQYISIH